MSVKIYRITLKNLRNSEYSIFVSQLVAIFLAYDPESLHLKKAFDRVVALLPQLEKIKVQEYNNTFSNLLRDLDNERDNLFNAIIYQVKNFSKLNIPSLAIPAAMIAQFLDKHGRDIPTDNYNSETKRIDNLLADYDSKADIKLAVEKMNLTILFDQLRLVNTQFATQFLLRTKEDAAIEKVVVVAIRMESDKELIAFFDAFEFCSSEYEDLDYVTPANEINKLISYYKAQLKARSTRRNAGKDVSTEKPIV